MCVWKNAAVNNLFTYAYAVIYKQCFKITFYINEEITGINQWFWIINNSST